MAYLYLEPDLMNSNVSMNDILEKVKRVQVHEINQARLVYGEYHHLFPVLKRYPVRFREYVRMNPITFMYILSQCEGRLEKNLCNLHQPIYPEEQLVLTLRFLASGASYKALGFTFRMGTSTVADIVANVMTVIWEEMLPLHMPVPSKQQLRKISDQFFQRWHFPHCQGAIDCRHVAIKKPAHSKSLFYNWKKFYSIKLQAVVNAHYKFIFIEVGDYGSTHDSTTFKNSKLFECLQAGTFQFLPDDELPDSGITLPYYLIGDGAYTLQEHLMKPYRGKDLLPVQQLFNKCLSGTRIVVECAFGHLYQMWEIFQKTMSCTPEIATLITKCACLLRNIIIDIEGYKTYNPRAAGDLSKENSFVGDIDSSTEFAEFVVGFGKEVREELTKYFTEKLQ